MKGGPKTSLRPFLHQALHLLFQIYIAPYGLQQKFENEIENWLHIYKGCPTFALFIFHQ